MAQTLAKSVANEVHQPPAPSEFFPITEREDEAQIMQELQGELIDSYVYRFQYHGKEVVGLSYAGVKEAIRRRGGVEILDFAVTESETEYRAIVKVRDHIKRIDVVGAATMKKSEPFAYTIVINKAERNAWRKLLPEGLMARVIREFQKRKKQRTVEEVTPAGAASR